MSGQVSLESAVTAGVAAAAVGASQVQAINDIIIPFFGVPITVITMAAGGALVSFAHGEPMRDRKKLFKLAAANTFLATILVVVVPKMLGWQWAEPEVVPPLAAVGAWCARWFVPATIKLMPDVVKKVFGLGEYNKSKNFYGDEYGTGELEDKYYDEHNQK